MLVEKRTMDRNCIMYSGTKKKVWTTANLGLYFWWSEFVCILIWIWISFAGGVVIPGYETRRWNTSWSRQSKHWW